MRVIVTSEACGVVRESVSRWTSLERELGMLCRGLSHSWCADLRAVSTVVSLPGDAEYEQAVCTLCQRVADEFGVLQSVRRDGDAWAICFSRPVGENAARGGRGDQPHFRLVRALLAHIVGRPSA